MGSISGEFGLPRAFRHLACAGLILTSLSGCASEQAGVTQAATIGAIVLAPVALGMAIVNSEVPQETEEERAAQLEAIEGRAERGDAESAAQYANLTGDLTYLTRLSEAGDPKAAAALQKMIGTAEGAAQLGLMTGDLTYLEQLADSGNRDAAAVLETLVGTTDAAVTFAEDTGNTDYLELHALEGDQMAAVVLAQEFGMPDPLRTLANDGDRDSAIELVRINGEVTETLRTFARNGDRVAAYWMARRGKDLGPLKAMAEQGDFEAAHWMARRGKDLGPLKAMAEQGDFEAANVLATEFRDASYLESLVSKDDFVVAYEDDFVAAYELYLQLRTTDNETQFLPAWKLLCQSANSGYAKAQAEVGNWHRTANWQVPTTKRSQLLRQIGVRPDNRIAYMWYTLAIGNGGPTFREVRQYLFAGVLTYGERTQAEQTARDWKPGDCPSKEHRLGSPGET